MRTISTNVPLNSGVQWPLAGVINNYALESMSADRITGYVVSDQAGNIFIEQAFDIAGNSGNGFWDISTTYAITANTAKTFSEEIIAPWVRVRYVNGGTNQGFIRLYARMESAGPRP